MPNYHVHVYKLSALCEVDIEADDSKDAMKKALDKVKNDDVKFTAPDNEYIALPFEVNEA